VPRIGGTKKKKVLSNHGYRTEGENSAKHLERRQRAPATLSMFGHKLEGKERSSFKRRFDGRHGKKRNPGLLILGEFLKIQPPVVQGGKRSSAYAKKKMSFCGRRIERTIKGKGKKPSKRGGGRKIA